MDIQEKLCKEYEEKTEECFLEKIEHDKRQKRHRLTYMQEEPMRNIPSGMARFLR